MGEHTNGCEVSAETLLRLGSATLHEASGQLGALPAGLQCMVPGARMAGTAVTVSGPPGDNLWLHRAVYESKPGDVIVAYVGGAFEWGYWGEVLSCAARARSIAGVVIDGCVRDIARLAAVGVPIFARGAAIRGTAKHRDGAGEINADIVLGQVVVHPGDWVVGDGDGLVVLARDSLAATVQQAEQRVAKESEMLRRLRDGARTLDLYDLTE